MKKIWFSSDQACSKRLTAIIPLWLPSYEEKYGALSSDMKHKLLNISHATIDRILKPIRVTYKKRNRCTTKPGSLKVKIPINPNQWDVNKPGFFIN